MRRRPLFAMYGEESSFSVHYILCKLLFLRLALVRFHDAMRGLASFCAMLSLAFTGQESNRLLLFRYIYIPFFLFCCFRCWRCLSSPFLVVLRFRLYFVCRWFCFVPVW